MHATSIRCINYCIITLYNAIFALQDIYILYMYKHKHSWIYINTQLHFSPVPLIFHLVKKKKV